MTENQAAVIKAALDYGVAHEMNKFRRADIAGTREALMTAIEEWLADYDGRTHYALKGLEE